MNERQLEWNVGGLLQNIGGGAELNSLSRFHAWNGWIVNKIWAKRGRDQIREECLAVIFLCPSLYSLAALIC